MQVFEIESAVVWVPCGDLLKCLCNPGVLRQLPALSEESVVHPPVFTDRSHEQLHAVTIGIHGGCFAVGFNRSDEPARECRCAFYPSCDGMRLYSSGLYRH